MTWLPRITRALIATIVVLLACTTDTGSKNPRPQEEQSDAPRTLSESAAEFSDLPAVRYTGYYIDSDGERVDVALRTINTGETIGTLVSRDRRAGFLSVDDKSFVRGSRAFWSAQGVTDANQLVTFSGRWVRLRPADLGIDIPHVLAPASMGESLAGLAATAKTEPAALDGRRVGRITAPGWTVFVTNSTPPEVVRIEAADSAGEVSIAPGMKAAASSGGFELNVGDASPNEVSRVYGDIARTVRQELDGAADSAVNFSVTASGNLTGCNVGLCVVTVQVSNQIATPNDSDQNAVTAVMTVQVSIDGRPVGTCTDSKPLPPNGSTNMTCSVRAPPSALKSNQPHTANAAATVRARAVTKQAIERVIKDLNEKRRGASCAGGDQCSPLVNFDRGALERPEFIRDVARGERKDSPSASRKFLARNMISMGLERPPGTAAHHIVAWSAGSSPNAPAYLKKAAEARRILERYGVEINSAANGVFLRTPIHQRLHTANYYQGVTERLRDARSREDVVDILDDLREQLLRAPGTLR